MNLHVGYVYLFLQKMVWFSSCFTWICFFSGDSLCYLSAVGAFCSDFVPEDLKQSKPHSHWFSEQSQEDELFIFKSVDFSMISGLR